MPYLQDRRQLRAQDTTLLRSMRMPTVYDIVTCQVPQRQKMVVSWVDVMELCPDCLKPVDWDRVHQGKGCPADW